MLDVIEQVLKRYKLHAVKTELMWAFFKYCPIHDVEGVCGFSAVWAERGGGVALWVQRDDRWIAVRCGLIIHYYKSPVFSKRTLQKLGHGGGPNEGAGPDRVDPM